MRKVSAIHSLRRRDILGRHRREIGFSVIPEARGRGYATEIAQALVANAFDQPGVQVVNARTADSNVPSARVLLRCGFHRVGPGAEPGTVEYQIARICF
jgi:RimJ/RimL family protein N-acetyltransferase